MLANLKLYVTISLMNMFTRKKKKPSLDNPIVDCPDAHGTQAARPMSSFTREEYFKFFLRYGVKIPLYYLFRFSIRLVKFPFVAIKFYFMRNPFLTTAFFVLLFFGLKAYFGFINWAEGFLGLY